MENIGKLSEPSLCILCKHYNFLLGFCRVHLDIVPDSYAVKHDNNCNDYQSGYFIDNIHDVGHT